MTASSTVPPPGEQTREPAHDAPPGPLAARRSQAGPRSGRKIPAADEIESAKLLANETREELHRLGLTDQEIDELADDFVAEDRGEDAPEFVAWVRYTQQRRRRSSRGPARNGT